MPPAVRRRGRDAEPTEPAQDAQAVRACTYGPPCPASFGDAVLADRTLRRGPDVFAQPFTRCVGRSASPAVRRPSAPVHAIAVAKRAISVASRPHVVPG